MARRSRVDPGGGRLSRTGSASAVLGGEVVGAVGQHRGMGWGQLALGQGLGGVGEGLRNTARAVRTARWASPAPIWSRVRSQLAVEAAWMPSSAPAAPRLSTTASSPSRRLRGGPPAAAGQDPLGQGGIGQAVQLLGVELIDQRRRSGQPSWWELRMCSSSLERTYRPHTRGQALARKCG